MRHLKAIALLALCPVLLPCQTIAPSGLSRLLEAESSRIPAKVGIYLKHMTTGEEVGIREHELFNSASVIKLTVMVIAYQMADAKQLDMNERVELKQADFRGGSGVLRLFTPGLMPTIHDIITQMVITSDNTATDLMIAKVGGVARVNQWLKDNGYTELRLVQTTFDLFALFAKERGAEFNKRTETDQTTWLGAISPREIGRLLEGINKGTIASKASCDDMQRIMRNQQSGARRLPHFITVPVGHKTGDLATVANDVGIIYSKSGPIVIAVYLQNITGNYGEAEDRIGEIARLVVEYFDGAR
jgi:beta-lactamase class A